MNQKLTLSIDKIVINQAKKKLQTRHQSLSKLIEEYFLVLIAAKQKSKPDQSVVSELTGIAKPNQPVDQKQVITDYLLKKYL